MSQTGVSSATVNLIFSSDEEEQLALAVQAAGKQIGLNWKLQKLPYAQFTERLSRKPAKRPYDAYIGGWSSDLPDPAGNLEVPFSSKNWLGNLVNYHNPVVDRDLAQQRRISGEATRAHLLTAAQARIVPDQAWVLFYSPRTLMALNEKLGGYALRPLWYWDSWLADIGRV
jgi:ABC-type transport system substrate-binding protein